MADSKSKRRRKRVKKQLWQQDTVKHAVAPDSIDYSDLIVDRYTEPEPEWGKDTYNLKAVSYTLFS